MRKEETSTRGKGTNLEMASANIEVLIIIYIVEHNF